MGKHHIPPPPPLLGLFVPFPKGLNCWFNPCKIIILSNKSPNARTSLAPPTHLKPTVLRGGWGWGSKNVAQMAPSLFALKMTNLLVFSILSQKSVFET